MFDPHQPSSNAIPCGLAVLCLMSSIVLLAWMWIGGLTPYAPDTVTPAEMQNIYLGRILFFGTASILLQLVCIFLVTISRRSR